MGILTINDLKAGMVLAQPAKNRHGTIILGKGNVLAEKLSPVIQKEVEAQINLGNFGQAISKCIPLSVQAEVFGKESNRCFSIMIAPLSNLKRTIGAVVIVFEEDKDFIRQQTLKLLHILVDFFSLSLENAYLFDDLKSAYFNTIKAITNSIEARDPYTKGHSERVARFSKAIAEELNWDKPEDALKEISRNAGTQFDPEVVRAFERAWISGKVICGEREFTT